MNRFDLHESLRRIKRRSFASRAWIPAVAALALPSITHAAIVHCVGQNVDAYWKFAVTDSKLDARSWESGQWSGDLCQLHSHDYGAGYLCEVYADKYVISFSNGAYMSRRTIISRIDGAYLDGQWNGPNMADYSSKQDGKCTLSDEPIAKKVQF